MRKRDEDAHLNDTLYDEIMYEERAEPTSQEAWLQKEIHSDIEYNDESKEELQTHVSMLWNVIC
jgi:hypothetical protein